MINVIVKPNEIWGYFQKHKKRLEDKLDSVAELSVNKSNTPVARVYLTNEKGFPAITIEEVHDDIETVIFEDCAINENDCISVYKNILTALERFDKENESENQSVLKAADDTDAEIVSARESELLTLLDEFIVKLMGFDDIDTTGADNEELKMILDAIELLMFEAGFIIYRPQIVKINGKDYLVESPYEEDISFC